MVSVKAKTLLDQNVVKDLHILFCRPVPHVAGVEKALDEMKI